jgi:hypothetical protein
MDTWKRRGLVALLVVLALVGAFVAGRFSAPLQVQTIDVVKVAFQDREVVREVVKVEKAKAETKIVWRDRIVTKDGTVTVREVEKTDTKTDTVRTGEGVKVSDRVSSSESSHTQTVTLRPKWRVGLQVGAAWPKPLLPIAGPLVLGLQVDYRIVGGLTAGVWLNTFGAAGVGLSFEF